MCPWLEMAENLYAHAKLFDKLIYYSGIEFQQFSGGKSVVLKPQSGNDFKIFGYGSRMSKP